MADQNNPLNQPNVSHTPPEAPAVPPVPPAPGQAEGPQEAAPQAAPAPVSAPTPAAAPVGAPAANPSAHQPGATDGTHVQQEQAAPVNPYAQQAPPANSYTPQGQPYGANPYGQPTAVPNYAGSASQNDGKATAALVFGILAIVFLFTVVGGILFGIIAIVLGVLSKKNGPDGKAKGGIVCGIIGLVLSVLIAIIGFAAGIAMLGYDSHDLDEIAITEDFDDITSAPNAGTDPSESSTENPQTEGAVSNIDFNNINTTIADDQYCTVTVNRAEIDAVGNLSFYFTMTNNSDEELQIWSNLGSWKLNGEAVDLYCYTEVEPGETVDDYFFIEAASLPRGGLDAIFNLSGELTLSTLDETLSGYTFSLS